MVNNLSFDEMSKNESATLFIFELAIVFSFSSDYYKTIFGIDTLLSLTYLFLFILLLMKEELKKNA